MQTTAGNEYQDEFIDGISITVYATQDTVEHDSFGNQYDASADERCEGSLRGQHDHLPQKHHRADEAGAF